jgi:cytochrome c-type biogenesis protein
MSPFLEAFALGNAAILSNVCLLPLYPGLMVMLANRGDRPDDGSHRFGDRLLGVAVLAGIVTFMIVLGFVLHQLQRSVASILDWVLPLAYGSVLVLGALLVAGRNPFARLSSTEAPLLRSPTASAYVYGMFLAPMTLPCTGPIIVSAFVLGGVSGTGALIDQVWYFVAFALGFGWPLVVLPFVALPLQRRFTRWLAAHHRAVAAVSGIVLVAVAAVGLVAEYRNLTA